LENAIDYANSGYVVVALIHLWNYFTNSRVKEDFEKLVDKSNTIMTMRDYLRREHGLDF